MKTLILLMLSYCLHAQVGIGTINPTATLDVNGTFRERGIQEGIHDKFVVVDDDGNHYWMRVNNLYPFIEDKLVSTEPKTARVFTGGAETLLDVDLDIEIPIVIPANTTAYLRIDYSVPLGTTITTPQDLESYMGITFWLDGVMNEDIIDKFNLNKTNTSNDGTISVFNHRRLTGVYKHEIVNTSSTPTTSLFEIKGLLEQYNSDLITHYIWNMWSDTGSNENWGITVIWYRIDYR